jgi:hypothetical protein
MQKIMNQWFQIKSAYYCELHVPLASEQVSLEAFSTGNLCFCGQVSAIYVEEVIPFAYCETCEPPMQPGERYYMKESEMEFCMIPDCLESRDSALLLSEIERLTHPLQRVRELK